MVIRIDVDKDRLTGGYQLAIGDETGGYRIAGPKYSGHSESLQSKTLSESDAREILKYLLKGFPSLREEVSK